MIPVFIGRYCEEKGSGDLLNIITLFLVFLGGVCFGILLIGLMAANDETERKENRK